MNRFIEFCIYRFKPPSPPTPVSPESPESPVSPVPKKKCCANFCCNSFDDGNAAEWVTVVHHQRQHRFCTIDCKNEWLNDPSQIGSWSPPLQSQEFEDVVPDLQIDNA